jgi:hypothetical protein
VSQTKQVDESVTAYTSIIQIQIKASARLKTSLSKHFAIFRIFLDDVYGLFLVYLMTAPSSQKI